MDDNYSLFQTDEAKLAYSRAVICQHRLITMKNWLAIIDVSSIPEELKAVRLNAFYIEKKAVLEEHKHFAEITLQALPDLFATYILKQVFSVELEKTIEELEKVNALLMHPRNISFHSAVGNAPKLG